jgi:hypothetical protein
MLGGLAIRAAERAPLLLSFVILSLLAVGPSIAWGDSGLVSGSYISYVIVVNSDVLGGPLALYGFKSFYARILVSFGPNGRVVGTAYIVDSYPDILFTPYWRGYVEDVLDKALAIVGSSMENPPAHGGWVKDGTRRSIVFVVSQDAGQEVYKCRAIGWRTSIIRSRGFEGGYVKAYTDPSGRYPLQVEASFKTGWYKVSLKAEAQYIHGMESPCGNPVETSTLRDALGVSVIAVTAAALVAYAKRPRTPMVILREAYWP